MLSNSTLTRRTGLTRSAPMPRGESRLKPGKPPARRKRMNRVSAKRKAAQPLRDECRRVVLARDTVCRYPGCRKPATDVHELLTRARGGDPHDPANAVGLCSYHHIHKVHGEPDAAEKLRLLVPSWAGRAVA